MPEPPAKKAKDAEGSASKVNANISGEPSTIREATEAEISTESSVEAPDKICGDGSKQASSAASWPDSFTTRLAPFLSIEKVEEVKKMFLEGPEPPFVSDAGWSGRLAAKVDESGVSVSMDIDETGNEDEGKKGGSKRGRDRGGRGGRGRGRGRGGKPARADHRKVISEVGASLAHVDLLQMSRTQPIVSKPTRTSFHQTVRELFDGKLESETDTTETANTGDGSRIVIRWARRGNGGGSG